MGLKKEVKQEIITKFAKNAADTGSTSAQIAMISQRLLDLNQHFSKNKKDHASRRGLLKLVGQRKSLLTYLKNKNRPEFDKVTAELGIRS